MKTTSRLPDVGISIFTVMSRLAAEHQAINLSQGFPDFPVSDELIELIHRMMKEGHNQYAPMAGAIALRQAIAQVIEQTYQRTTDFETEVTVTAGATEALFATIAALVHPGDEVMVFDPAYDSYDPAIRLNGGIPIHINLLAPDFSIPWQEVESRITSQTKVIIVNTPHNPSGSILSQQDMQTLERLANHHNLFVISDEVYERIIFEDKTHESALKYPGLANRSVSIFSFGKTFHATGWKVGYAVACPALSQEIRKTHQFITFSVNTPVQLALATYLNKAEHYLSLGKFYQQKRDFFLSCVAGTSLQPLPCYGSYFQLFQYESTQADTEMAEWMTKTCKVAPIPVSGFYRDKTDQRLLRFCFAKTDETLARAGEILKKL